MIERSQAEGQGMFDGGKIALGREELAVAGACRRLLSSILAPMASRLDVLPLPVELEPEPVVLIAAVVAEEPGRRRC